MKGAGRTRGQERREKDGREGRGGRTEEVERGGMQQRDRRVRDGGGTEASPAELGFPVNRGC